jgi:hypothetical protein
MELPLYPQVILSTSKQVLRKKLDNDVRGKTVNLNGTKKLHVLNEYIF